MMSGSLYDDDIVVWSEQQADLLRRAATGERVNGLDWPNLIEEIESVGRSELHACESLLLQALRHLLKCAAWPRSEATYHWQAKAATFLTQAYRAFTPSMRQKLDLARIYADALYAVRRDRIDGSGPGPLPETCPFVLDDVLVPYADLDALIGRLGAGGRGTEGCETADAI